jgi:diguanylate cyclase (GGDEF)-like protein/PAS domain S-box-containing protein
MEERERLSLRHSQMARSCQIAPLAAWFHLILAIGISLWLNHVQHPSLLPLWLPLMAGVQMAGLGGYVLQKRLTPQRQSSTLWPALLLGLYLCSGLLWGLGPGYFFFSDLAPYQQTVVLWVLLGVAAAGVWLQPTTSWATWLFVASVLLPLTIQLHGQGEARLAGMVLFAALLLGWIHSHTHRTKLVQALLQRQYLRTERDKLAYMRYFTNASEIAKLASWELNLKTGVLHWSDEAYAMYGLAPDQPLKKKTVMSTLHWADREDYFNALEASLKGHRKLDREFRVVHPDGSVRVLHDTAELVFDEEGKADRMIGVIADITGQVQAEFKSRNADIEFDRILNHMQDTYYRTDPAGRLTLVSNSVERLLGYPPREATGMHVADLYSEKRHGQFFLQDLHAQGGTLRNYEIKMRHRQGQQVWVSVNAQLILNEQGKTIGIEGTIRDITELKRARLALHQEKELALVTLQSIGDGVITTDEHGMVKYLNPSAEHLLGKTYKQASGRHFRDVLPLVDEMTGESLGDLVRMCMTQAGSHVQANDGLLIREDGSRFHLKITTAAMRDHYGHVVGAVLVLHDITEVMNMAQQLSYQASHDVLTGLYNRRVFEKRLEEAIRSAMNGDGEHVLCYLDLDQFKVVNDTCGHKAGDELLQQIAMLMQRCVRETDVLARLGGDEFGVLLEHCHTDKAVQIAEKLRHAVRSYRFVWDDKSFELGVSIGVVPIQSDSGNLAHVLAAADTACYVAKDDGRNRLHVYQSDDEAVMQHTGEIQWVHRLASAFDTNSFELFAQPIVHVAGDRVVSHYEILIRMRDEKGRLIPPGAFIPAAERYNLMPAIDRWVIRTTLEMLHAAQGDLAFPPVECAINLSGQSLCDDHFLEYVVDLFDETGVPCENINFEVTETAAVANLSRATRFISILRGMGCSFALDDFGAGISSFAYLKSLPIDYLKIDGAFVREMVHDQVDHAMVESINQIGHIMGLKTIGEYAENEAVLLALERVGVDFAQGYGVSAPKPFAEVLKLESRTQRSSVA